MNTAEKKQKNQLNYKQLIELIVKFMPKKDSIQAQFDSGEYKSISDFARINKLTWRQAESILDGIGVKYDVQKKVIKPTYSDLITVLVRVCEQLDINYDEIKKYQ